METIKNIKVEAHYDVENTSRFEALMKKYEIAKAIADETKAEKQPLIEAMGKKKLELIKEQLKPITEYAVALAKISGRENISVSHFFREDTYHEVTIDAWADGSVRIKLDKKNIEEYPDGNRNWFKENGIVTMWNELNFYDELEDECVNKLSRYTSDEESKTKRINNHYDRMTN